MKFLLPLLILVFLSSLTYSQELRGTWLSRNQLVSKELIAVEMDSLAANNFNVVYVDAWSRGYPLWQSKTFLKETGYSTDPIYKNRDILAETIAEAHRVGIEVEAWFEYGFVGGWSGNQPAGSMGPIFKNHSNWVEQNVWGNTQDSISSGVFYWMSHTRPDVQNFLISLMTELARNYDLDGIELDRIRLAGLEWGYDSYTDSLYKSEHNGIAPPKNYSDASWLRWRADKINQFIARSYDSVKSINPNLNISNAPSLYSSNSYTAYNDLAQDWVTWVNSGTVDNVQIQSYVSSSSTFGSIMNYAAKLISDKNKAFPCFAVSPNGVKISNSELVNFIKTTRANGFKGNSIWYYPDLIPIFPFLKSTVYSTKTYPPYSKQDWRDYHSISLLSDSANIIKKGNWLQSSIYGFNGPSYYCTSSDSASLEYYPSIHKSGFYEVYVYNIISSNRTDSAKYTLIDSLGNEKNYFVSQSNINNKGWFKLDDIYLGKGKNLAVKLDNNNLQAGKLLSADAVMIILNRRLSPDTKITDINSRIESHNKMSYDFNLKSYPNPFNNQFQITFTVDDMSRYSLNIFNILGQRVYHLNGEPKHLGENQMHLNFDTTNLPTGVYFVNLSQGNKQESIKIVLTK